MNQTLVLPENRNEPTYLYFIMVFMKGPLRLLLDSFNSWNKILLKWDYFLLQKLRSTQHKLKGVLK